MKPKKPSLNRSIMRLYNLIMVRGDKIPKKELRPLIEELEVIRDEL